MNEEGLTAYQTQDIDNLNLAALLVAYGVPVADRKVLRVTTLDSTTHDATRGTWTFQPYSIDGSKATIDIMSEFRLPKTATTNASEIYYLACHNWLCLKSVVKQNKPLYYSFLDEAKKLVRLSNISGNPINAGNMSVGTTSLILSAIAITLGVVPMGYSFNLGKMYIQLPPNDTVKTAYYMLTHIDEIKPDDMSLLAILCTAMYNREEMKKDIYKPSEQIAIKYNGQTAFIAKDANNTMMDRVAEKLSI